ncbi:hypothetical protein Ga0074812_104388 [Parafrankia irregularis]|uniref:Uncharacterized protein n=1 Tax=Parafrankia irregularis TaxID=795642 RepID=A0A0S4QI59_9ACTN|nr:MULTISPECIES: hypothetical protein [Parafrankia]MBE3203824.1 hypothetical protein [Parafrankia sp. CH37]CUU55307.1 hypothetical protein Ga0074812_104388 [Parafrankia irregularis]
MATAHTFLQRSAGRAILVAALAAGLAGGALSASHTSWFSGATSDAGVIPIGGGVGGPIKGGPIVIVLK